MKAALQKSFFQFPTLLSHVYLLLSIVFISPSVKTQELVPMDIFQSLLDSNNLQGSVLIYDPRTKTYFSNDFDWAKVGRLPASTYKIPHSIIALESEVVKDSQSIFLWKGEDRYLDVWERDLTFKQAFQLSCVPCYQEIAGKIGVKRMNDWLNKLEYGHMQVKDGNLTVFWLEGESKINQFEQIDFLQRFYDKKLPITPRTHSIIKDILVLEENAEYKLSAKTGWAIRNGHNNGWFVGYLEKGDKLWFFATNISPREKFSMDLFPMIRSKVSLQALQHLIDDPDYDQKYNKTFDR
jgi:beta-lactamase class D